MRVSWSPGYVVPLPEGHPFPMGKFEALHRILRGVFAAVRRLGVPVAIVLSGGYASTPEKTAELHATAFREARLAFG